MESVDVIIPAYNPGKEFERLLEALSTQSYPVQKILVMNTEEKYWKKIWEKRFPIVEVHHLKKKSSTMAEPEKKPLGFQMLILWYL